MNLFWKIVLITVGVIVGIVLLYALIAMLARRSDTVIRTFTPDELKKAEEGREYIQDKILTIGGLARNSSKAFKENIAFFERMCQYFKQVNVGILENDSEDGTRELYLDYIDNAVKPPNLDLKLVNDSKVNLRECKLNLKRTFSGSTDTGRIGKMVRLRNELSKSLFDVFGDSDFTYISDFDIQGEIFTEGILNTFYYFKNDPEVDAVCYLGIWNFFGLQTPFDPYAFSHYPGKDEKYNVAPPPYCFIPLKWSKIHNGLYRVKSAFAGGFFVRSEAMKKSKYELQMASKTSCKCEHHSFFENMNTYINSSMLRYVDSHVS